jgi:hypothetical protein
VNLYLVLPQVPYPGWYWYKAGIASGIPSWCVLQYQYPYQYHVPSYTLFNGITLGIYSIANAPKYLTLSSVSSVNNPQNNEMKFCEKYEVDILKIIIIIVGYTLNNFTTHITIV